MQQQTPQRPASRSRSVRPANLTNADIAAYAQRIGDHHKIYGTGPADLPSLLEALGGELAYARDSESLKIRQPGDFTIYLPSFTSVRRDRFTIAHELGHYFLHYRLPEQTGPALFFRGARNRAETEANVFASSLLMPAVPFVNAWKECDGEIWRISNAFMVSPEAARVRAEVLRLC